MFLCRPCEQVRPVRSAGLSRPPAAARAARTRATGGSARRASSNAAIRRWAQGCRWPEGPIGDRASVGWWLAARWAPSSRRTSRTGPGQCTANQTPEGAARCDSGDFVGRATPCVLARFVDRLKRPSSLVAPIPGRPRAGLSVLVRPIEVRILAREPSPSWDGHLRRSQQFGGQALFLAAATCGAGSLSHAPDRLAEERFRA
jgi:hypothetical protein